MAKSVFLCHNGKDKSFVRRLATDLSLAGATVWLDEAEIKLGDSLLGKIEEGICGSEYLAVVLSPNSIKSEWVKRELQIALTKEIAQKKVRVLPLLYRDCQIPAFLSDKVYADFRDEDNYSVGIEMLVDRIGLSENDETIHVPTWLVGRWKGEWKWQDKNRIAELKISVTSMCRMIIEYEKTGVPTIVEQQLSISADNYRVKLVGFGYRFLERGNAVGYHLDKFSLQSSTNKRLLFGNKVDKRGIEVPVVFSKDPKFV